MDVVTIFRYTIHYCNYTLAPAGVDPFRSGKDSRMMTLILLAAFIVIAGGVLVSLRRVQPDPVRVRIRDRHPSHRYRR